MSNPMEELARALRALRGSPNTETAGHQDAEDAGAILSLLAARGLGIGRAVRPAPSPPPSGNVVRLEDRRLQHRGADAGFLTCPYCGTDEFAVVCRGLPAQPYVAALLCADCEPPMEISITVGRVGHAGA